MAKNERSEVCYAGLKAVVSVVALLTILSGVFKDKDSDKSIPIYLLNFSEVSDQPLTSTSKQFSAPTPTSAKKVNFKNFFTDKSEKTSAPKSTFSEKSESSSDQQNVVSQNSYPKSESFSSFYSKADYHYEEAARLIKKPKLLNRGEFIYPQKAWDRQISGTYKAKLWVNIQGLVVKVEVLDVDDTFGFASAIVQMGKGFKYEPVIVRGLPVAFTIVVPFEFVLE